MTGTHDIVGVTIGHNALSVQIDYASNSRAVGGLLIFMFITEGRNTVIDFSKSAFIILTKNASSDYTLPFQLSLGVYFVFTYDIEDNGLIYSGVVDPAVTVIHSLTGNIHSKSLFLSCCLLLS